MIIVQRGTIRVFSLEFPCTELLLKIEGPNVTLTIPWHGTECIVAESNTDTVFGVEDQSEAMLFRWAIAVYSEWIINKCNQAIKDVTLNHNRPLVTENRQIPF